MGQDWLIDVLADLRAFARENRLPVLTEQLEDTMLVAAAELAQVADRGPFGQTGCDTESVVGHPGRGDQSLGSANSHSRAS